MRKAIPVVDLFAGPGGLGEGFSAVLDQHAQPVFRIGVSIEKDPVAHKTLSLRAAYRLLRAKGRLQPYYAFLEGRVSPEEFYSHPHVRAAMAHSAEEAKCAELGKIKATIVDGWIKGVVGERADWVLIGGPPCQAYSLVGRARRTKDKTFEADEKHFLYREYLRIISKFAPPVFVMENVKGMLSSKHGGSGIFPRILEDLKRPTQGLEYEIRSFIVPGTELEPADYIIKSESLGIPQARHRVILLGVRKDRCKRSHLQLLPRSDTVSAFDVLGEMPPLRSTVSRGADTHEEWLSILRQLPDKLSSWKSPDKAAVLREIKNALSEAASERSSGRAFSKHRWSGRATSTALKWIRDPGLQGVIQHEARGHMAGDLHRYLFSASFGAALGYTPKLKHFPEGLLPEHKNASLEDAPFTDRFRVQLKDQPSSTVVSHIAKDGHYYIHFDPSQCRSLTVREAARLQTFPDNYFFAGNRTQQFGQVGNAVPPLLAYKLAESVARLFHKGAMD